jgi:hypothetical protein
MRTKRQEEEAAQSNRPVTRYVSSSRCRCFDVGGAVYWVEESRSGFAPLPLSVV